MGALRLTPPGSPTAPRHGRQRSCDSVCALTITALGMEACADSAKLLEQQQQQADDLPSGAAAPAPAHAVVPATECAAYDAMRADLAARVRNEAALDPKEQAAYALNGLLYDEFEIAVKHANAAGIPLAEVLARSERVVQAQLEDERFAASELERIGNERFTPQEQKWHDMATQSRPDCPKDMLLTLNAERELGANSMRVRIARLERRATGPRIDLQRDLLTTAVHSSAMPPTAKKGDTHRRLGEAVGERLHARAAAGSMASPALARRTLADDALKKAAEIDSRPAPPLLSVKPTLTWMSRGKGAKLGEPERDELQRTLDALWSGRVVGTVPQDDADANPTRLGLLRARPSPVPKDAATGVVASQREQLAASFRDIEWLWTQQRTWSSTRTRADPLGDLVQTLDVGMWHVTERVDWLAAVCVFGAALREEDSKPAYPGLWAHRNDPAAAFEKFFDAKPTTRRGSVVVRRTRLDAQRDLDAAPGQVPTVRDLLGELALAAHADQCWIGPKLYGCYATPVGSNEVERLDLNAAPEAMADLQQSEVLSEVVVLSEPWDGHCGKGGGLYQELLCSTKFCELFVELVIRTASYGVFHGDLKRENVLFVLGEDRKVAALALSNFDPAFVKLVPAHRAGRYQKEGPWTDGVPCLAVLMVMCFLAEVRCQSDKWVGPPLANALARAMFAELCKQLKPKAKDEDVLEAALHAPTLRLVCDRLVGRDDDDLDVDATAEALAQRVKNFMARREDAPPEVPCLGEHLSGPELRGFRAARIPSTAARLVAHAATGKDLWARTRPAGRRGKAP